MSNRRVKSLDYEDDGYDDYDEEYDDGGGEISVEDQQQLKQGTIRVREALGGEYSVTDKEIQDVLWDYYYDIGKTVAFLKNKHKPKQAPKPKPAPNKISTNFFNDCPWGNIPGHREALIIEEKLYTGGLLGGSSGKMSKLAALAAKRRQKEIESVQSTKSADASAALSRLTIQQKKPETREEPPPPEIKIESESVEEEPKVEEPVVARAAPSSFANTILASSPPSNISTKLQLLKDDKAFDFSEPSPDDIIYRAQTATPSKPKEKSKQVVLTNAVSNSTVQEPKVKSKNIDVVSEYKKVKRKNAANFVVIGHVDAGKSTLMGRLLFDLKAVDQRTLDKYKKEAENIGKGSFAFAWVLDQGSEERERGVTIDIATNKFETEKTNFTILDAPGHQDFVPNMIAGASQADFAVLVIDASGSNFEAGLRGQTKEHALLARSIGVSRIIVAVNKMDMAGWSEIRLNDIQQQTMSLLTSAGFQSKNLAFVPCSGLEGGNILQRTKDQKASWYKGSTLVEELDMSEPVTHSLEKPLRMTIADVFRGGVQNPLSVSGRLEAGTIQVGEQILVMPSGEKANINRLEVDDEPQDWAVAGQNVVLHLSDIDSVHLKTGDVVCSSTSPIKTISKFKAKILTFTSLTPQLVDVHRGRLHVPGRISQLLATLDKTTGVEIKKKPKVTQPGMIVRVTIEVDTPVPLEATARVIFRSGGETIAAGLIE